MQKLIAKTAILHKSKMYSVGDELPTNDADMVEAWTEAGTAVWISDDAKKTTVKVRPATAEPGLAGDAKSSESEDGENLIGKVPKTAARTRKKPKE